MSSLPVARHGEGHQRPRILSSPPAVSSTGQEALELAAVAGIELDPWEAFVLDVALGERADGKWAAFEVGVNAPRQNGKNEIVLVRQLAGLYLLGERLLIHSAHQFDTSLEHFRRLRQVVEDTPQFSRRLKPRGIKASHGEEGIELKGGQRIRFRTRTKGGGRGFTGDCLFLDEAMFIDEASHGTLLPTLSARPNPQVWYMGSAVDQAIHEDGIVFARLRARGTKGDPGLAYFEWSVDAPSPDEVGDSGETEWAEANPAFGIRISAEHIAREKESMAARTFAVERLGVGDWPRTDGQAERVITDEKWDAGADRASKVIDPICFAFDVTPDRSRSAIAASGFRADGLLHGEIVAHRRGTGWVVDWLEERLKKHQVAVVLCDAAGPAASLLGALEDRRIEVEAVTASEHAQACGAFFDLIEQGRFRHLDTEELRAAIRGADRRPLGDAWAWSRKRSAVDISPLVAVTLATWAAARTHESVYEEKELLVL
jgi:hypothetical protein